MLLNDYQQIIVYVIDTLNLLSQLFNLWKWLRFFSRFRLTVGECAALTHLLLVF